MPPRPRGLNADVAHAACMSIPADCIRCSFCRVWCVPLRPFAEILSGVSMSIVRHDMPRVSSVEIGIYPPLPTPNCLLLAAVSASLLCPFCRILSGVCIFFAEIFVYIKFFLYLCTRKCNFRTWLYEAYRKNIERNIRDYPE